MSDPATTLLIVTNVLSFFSTILLHTRINSKCSREDGIEIEMIPENEVIESQSQQIQQLERDISKASILSSIQQSSNQSSNQLSNNIPMEEIKHADIPKRPPRTPRHFTYEDDNPPKVGRRHSEDNNISTPRTRKGSVSSVISDIIHDVTEMIHDITDINVTDDDKTEPFEEYIENKNLTD